jgi:uncharacterized protein YjiS (DUF1127 family)
MMSFGHDATMMARIRRWLAERRARRELLILSDAMLKDLAMDRSEIVSIVRCGQADRTRRSARRGA